SLNEIPVEGRIADCGGPPCPRAAVRGGAVGRAPPPLQLGSIGRSRLRGLGAPAPRQLQHCGRVYLSQPMRGAQPARRREKNGFAPGPADRGQPAYFYPRENHFLFKVNVPKDWDRKKELVWTIVANGKSEVARATLLDIWEIDRKVEVSNNGGVQITNEMI